MTSITEGGLLMKIKQFYERLLNSLENRNDIIEVIKTMTEALANYYEEEFNDSYGLRDIYYGLDIINFKQQEEDSDFEVEDFNLVAAPVVFNPGDSAITVEDLTEGRYIYDAYEGLLISPVAYLKELIDAYLENADDDEATITEAFTAAYPQLRGLL